VSTSEVVELVEIDLLTSDVMSTSSVVGGIGTDV